MAAGRRKLERLPDTEIEPAARLLLTAIQENTIVGTEQEPGRAQAQPRTGGFPQIAQREIREA